MTTTFEVGDVWACWFDTGTLCFTNSSNAGMIISHEPWTILQVNIIGFTTFLTVLYEDKKHLITVKNNEDMVYKIC